jgi:hypothetical protein
MLATQATQKHLKKIIVIITIIIKIYSTTSKIKASAAGGVNN